MPKQWTVLLLLSVLASPSAAGAKDKTPALPPVPVFVTSAGAVDGFTDPNHENQDTANDVRRAMTDRQRARTGSWSAHQPTLTLDAAPFTLVDTRDAATIVLVVLSRGRTRPLDCTVRVQFLYKDLAVEMSASSMPLTATSCGGGWGRSAGKVAKQVEDWIVVNRTKLP